MLITIVQALTGLAVTASGLVKLFAPGLIPHGAMSAASLLWIGTAEVVGGLLLLLALRKAVLLVPGLLLLIPLTMFGIIDGLIKGDMQQVAAPGTVIQFLMWLAFDRGPWALDWFTRFAPRPAGTTTKLLPARAIVTFPKEAPVLLEGIQPAADGGFYLTAGNKGQIWRVEPDGRWRVLAQLPHGGFGSKRFQGVIATVTSAPDGMLYTGLVSMNPRYRGIWQVDPETGATRHFSRFPKKAQPNGVTLWGDEALLVADSHMSVIWRVPLATGEAQIWLQAPRLGRKVNWVVPAANGIKLWQGHVYVTNTFTSELIRVKIDPDGSAGAIERVAGGIAGDDFSFDEAGNVYVTTHPFNSVVRISPDGTRTVVADSSQGVVGCTDAKFGVTDQDRHILYIVNDGGFVVPHRNGVPGIVALDVGIAGVRVGDPAAITG